MITAVRPAVVVMIGCVVPQEQNAVMKKAHPTAGAVRKMISVAMETAVTLSNANNAMRDGAILFGTIAPIQFHFAILGSTEIII